MKWIEVRVIFTFGHMEQGADLIAAVFFDAGVKGVVIEDPGMKPENTCHDDIREKPCRHAVSGYFPKNETGATQWKRFEKGLGRLRSSAGIFAKVVRRDIDEEDWAESWKIHFKPIKIGDRIIVKPTWHEYTSAADEIVIDIDPGMAFGTGTHPTTALCVEMLENYLQQGDAFLDIGTGSGILLIAAAKLGASRLRGVDQDDIAVNIARQNLLRNGIDARRFKVETGDLLQTIMTDRFDGVVANILLPVILKLVGRVPAVLNVGGLFICSGVLAENKARVVAAMEKDGFQIREIKTRDEWVAIAGQKQ